MKRLLALIPLLTACGNPNILHNTEVDPELQQWVDVAVQYLGYKKGNFQVDAIKMVDECRSSDSEGNCETNGTCYVEIDFASPYNGQRVIEINRGRWEAKNTYSRYGTIIHELLHCSYDIKHNDRKVSLMGTHSEDVISQADFEAALTADKKYYGFD